MAKPDIKIDNEFQTLIPPLAPDELVQLETSLKAEGCRDPLIVWKDHGILLDGHNRKRFCDKHDIPFKTVEVELPSREAAKAFIIRHQLARRNLSPEAASYLRGCRYLELKQQGKRTDLAAVDGDSKVEATSGQSDPKSKGKRLSEVLGAEYGVAEKTIRRDGRFAEIVDQITANCGLDAKKLILSRDAGLTRGGAARLAKLTPAKQKDYLEELKKSGRRPRGKRAKKARSFTLPSEPKALVAKLLERLEPKAAAQVAKLLAAALVKGK